MRDSSYEDAPGFTYGFVGLSGMGYSIAMSLRTKMPKASTLMVFDDDEAIADTFVGEALQHGKVESAESPGELAQRSNVIITCLATSPAVLKAFVDPVYGLLSAPSLPSGPTRLFIDTSTIDFSTSRAAHENVSDSGHGCYVDAPVSLSPSGSIIFTCGGSVSNFDRVKPILQMLSSSSSSSIFHCGEAGAGLAMKHISNYIAHCRHMALCEAFDAGLKHGLDPGVLGDVLDAVGSGRSTNPVESGQRVSTEAKEELRMAIGSMDEVGAKHALGDAVRDVYKRAEGHDGCERNDSFTA